MGRPPDGDAKMAVFCDPVTTIPVNRDSPFVMRALDATGLRSGLKTGRARMSRSMPSIWLAGSIGLGHCFVDMGAVRLDRRSGVDCKPIISKATMPLRASKA